MNHHQESWYRKRIAMLTDYADALGHSIPPASSLAEPTEANYATIDSLIRTLWAKSLESTSVADAYVDMPAFWDAYHAQLEGSSTGSIWESYVNGDRRRLERELAKQYGSEDALILSSGMAAIWIGLETLCELGASRSVAVGHAYFETNDLINGHFDRLHLQAAPSDEAVLLCEPIVNAPSLQAIDWPALRDFTRVLVDNSMFSHSLAYDAISESWPGAQILVAESLSKFVTNNVSAGALYGPAELIDRARLIATVLGVNVTRPVILGILPFDVTLAAARVEAHAAAAQAFAGGLDPNVWNVLVPEFPTPTPLVPKLEWPTGGLVYVTQRTPKLSVDETVTRVVKHTLATTSTIRGVKVRAGFGWAETTMRAYSGTSLNQSDAPEYIRVSVGAISPSEARAQAVLLNTIPGTEEG